MFCLFALLCHGRANGPLGFCQQNCFSTKERNASLERFQLKSSKLRQCGVGAFTLQAEFFCKGRQEFMHRRQDFIRLNRALQAGFRLNQTRRVVCPIDVL